MDGLRIERSRLICHAPTERQKSRKTNKKNKAKQKDHGIMDYELQKELTVEMKVSDESK